MKMTVRNCAYPNPTSQRRFRKLALSVCLSGALGLGFISNAQAHCTILHPGHCIEDAVDAIVNVGETINNEIIQPVGDAIISAGNSVVQFTETQINKAVDDIESAYNDVKSAYNEIKTRVETIANAQKLAHEFAEGIYTDLAMVGLAASDGLKDGRYNSMLNGLKQGDAQQVGQGVLVMLKNMALTPFNNLVNELNRQNAKSLLVGFQVEGGGSVGGVLSIGGSSSTQVGLAIDVAFLNWLQTQLNSNRFILSQLSANNLNQYNGIIGSMYIGGGFGFSGDASVGNLGNSAYIIGFHVNQPFATEGTTMDFETMVGDRAVGVSYNFDKFYQGEMIFEAVAIAYYNNGTVAGGSSAGVGFSAGISKTIGTLCSDFKFYGGTNSCATISLLGAHNKYAVAESNGQMNANRTSIGSFEKFNLINNVDGSVSFLSHHGKYASAQTDGTLVADRSAIGSWEKFTRVDHSDGTVSFRSHHGKYMVAESNGQMHANRTAIGSWEKFELISASVPTPVNPSGLIKARNNNSKCLHKKHGDTNNGNPIHLWDGCNATDSNQNDEWIYEASTGLIKSAQNTNKCLHKKDGNWNNGNIIHLWDCNAGSIDNKTWVYDANSNFIRAKNNNAKCLHKKVGDWNNGNIIHLWDCSAGSSDNKTWIIESSL